MSKLKPKFPLRQLLAAHAAMPQLDGYEQVVTSNNTDRVVRTPYRFAAEAYMPLAKVKLTLDLIAEAHGRARNALIVARTPADAKGAIDSRTHPDVFATVAEEINRMLEAEEEVELPAIPISSLKLEDNPVPVSAALVPLMAVGIIVA